MTRADRDNIMNEFFEGEMTFEVVAPMGYIPNGDIKEPIHVMNNRGTYFNGPHGGPMPGCKCEICDEMHS